MVNGEVASDTQLVEVPLSNCFQLAASNSQAAACNVRWLQVAAGLLLTGSLGNLKLPG
jgi:dihydroorotate dehydrogenase